MDKPTYIYTSPDGGETVYRQTVGGNDRELVSKSEHAKILSVLNEDQEMFTLEAYHIRKQYPVLENAYQQYKFLWSMIVGNK